MNRNLMILPMLWRRTSAGSVVPGALSILLFAVALLVPTSAVSAEAIAQDYQSDARDISRGALLRLVAAGSQKVELANSSTDAGGLVGIAAEEPLVALSGADGRNTQVVIGGSTEALVSDLGGDVKAGDKITVSPVSGIGMKADRSAPIVGTAQADLSKVKTVTRQLTDEAGQRRDMRVGLVPVAVNVTYYSASMGADKVSAFIPAFMQSMANTIAGRAVAPYRVLFSFLALVLGFVIVTVALQAAIRNGVISLGRNPLAYKALRGGLIDAIIASVAALLVACAIAYGLLVV